MHSVQQLFLQCGQHRQRAHVEHAVGDRRPEDLRDPAAGAASGPAVSHQEAATETADDEEPDAAATAAAGFEWPAFGVAEIFSFAAADAAVVQTRGTP